MKKMLMVQVLFAFIGSATSSSFATSTQPLQQTAKQRIELMLHYFNQKQYAKMKRMLSPTIQKKIDLASFRYPFEIIHKTIGKYKKGSLKQLSKQTMYGKTKFIWEAHYAREKNRVIALFDKRKQMVGFTIQSPKVTQAMRRETSFEPTAKQRQVWKQMLDSLLTGYNTKNWQTFCRYCSPLMKQVYSPSRFVILRKVLWKNYGSYQKRHFLHTRKLTSMKNMVILREKADFSKQKGLIIQTIFQKKNNRYFIMSWHLK